MTSPLARLRQASVAEQRLPGPEGASVDKTPSLVPQETIVNKPTKQQTNEMTDVITNIQSNEPSRSQSVKQTSQKTDKPSIIRADVQKKESTAVSPSLTPFEAALVAGLKQPLRKIKASELVLIGGRVHPEIKSRLESVALMERRSYQTIIEEGLKLYFAEVVERGLHEDEE